MAVISGGKSISTHFMSVWNPSASALFFFFFLFNVSDSSGLYLIESKKVVST